jgi:hypothetical protein
MGGVALHEFSSEMVGNVPFHLTRFISRGRLKPQQVGFIMSNTNTVSRVQGSWRHRGGSFRTDAAARFSI